MDKQHLTDEEVGFGAGGSRPPSEPKYLSDAEAGFGPPTRSAARSLGDSAIAAGSGVVQGVKMLTDVAGADNPVSRGLGKASDALTDLESPYRKAQKQERAAKIKTAEESGSTWEEIKAHAGSFADAPIDTTLNALGTSVPTIGAAMLTGGGSATAQVAARAAPVVIGAAQGVGNVKGQIHETVKNKHLEAGATEAEAARRADAAQSYGGDNLGSIALGGALGGVAGSTGAESAVQRLVGRKVAGDVAERAAPGIVRSAVTGVAKEAPMEAAQGGQERLASNVALQGEGFDVPTWQGVAGQAALEGLASAPMGGGFGVVEGAHARAQHRADQQARQNAEAAAADAQAKADALVPPWTTEPGAAGSNAEPGTSAAAPVNAPGVADADFTTSPGAADQRTGMDFAREADTTGLRLEDPAEVERARAATVDYEPAEATPQWSTEQGAAPARQGLDMPAREIDTAGLALDERTPSQRMGIDPTAGPLSKAAATAVDSGASAAAAQSIAQENANAQAAQAPVAGAAAPLSAARAAAVEAAGPAHVSTTTGVTSEPQADQAQQASAQPAQGPGAQAAALAVPDAQAVRGTQAQGTAGAPAVRTLTDGAPSQNPGAQSGAAVGPQAAAQAPTVNESLTVARPKNWRTSMLGAAPVARGLGINVRGKRLAQVVAEIDAADAATMPQARPYDTLTPQEQAAFDARHGIEPGRRAEVQAKQERIDRQALEAVAGVQPAVPAGGGGRTADPVTRTPAFRNWFGDSQVVDAEGNPLVMYHGTSGNQQGDAFTAFDTYASNYGLMGQGGYFTADPAVASSYTKKGKGTTPTVYPAYLSIKNPIDMDAKADPAQWQAQFDGIEDFHEGGASNESWYRAAEESLRDQSLPMWEGAEIMQDGLRAMGYDGITHMGGGRVDTAGVRHRVYIAFDPEQIKSATGNNGQFDPANPDIRYSKGMPLELAQALMNLRPARATKESVRAAIRELVNGAGVLPNRLGHVVVATSDEIKRDWKPLVGHVELQANEPGPDGKKIRTQGFYDPNTKTVFIIADNIKPGDELGVVAHELMHKHGQAVLGEEGWNRLHSTIEQWASAPEGSTERQVYDEAAERVAKSRPADISIPEYTTQELFPYAVQVALEMGVQPSALKPISTVAGWLAHVRGALRRVWNKIANPKGDFNSLDLVNLAFGIAQRENPAHRGELDGISRARAEEAAAALQEISEAGDLFALPKSAETTVAGIAAEHSPGITVRETDLGGETMHTLTMPDNTTATITTREPTRDAVYGMDEATGQWITERPGENAPPVGSKGDVWVDVSRLQPGKWGGVVYNIAATYAHNTGRIFIGDPSGLSDVAMRRRAEQMLGSALKFGSTGHLAPHPRQVAGDAGLGVPPLRWVYGDHEGNIGRLVDVNQRALENAYPEAKNLRYDPDTGNFIDSRTGEILTREQMAQAVAQGRSPVEREAGAGWRTVARGAVFRALLGGGTAARQGKGTGQRAEPGPGRSAVLDASGRGPDQSGAPRDTDIERRGGALAGLAEQRERLSSEDRSQRIFYSRSVAPAAGDYTPAQARAAEHAFGTQKNLTPAEKAKAFRANLGTKLRQGLVDQFAPIKEVSEKAYMLARMSKGSDGAVEAALLYGKPFLRDGVYDVDIKDGGFAKVLASLKGEDTRFLQWVAAQRAERLKAEGKENLLTDADISALKTLNAGRMADGTARLPAYAKALQELNAFNESTLKVAMDSGLIDQAAHDLMKDQPYVPFYRLMEEEGGMRGPRFSSGLVNQQAWKKLKGGTEQLNSDLLQNLLLNWSHLYAAAARNRASLEAMAAADKMGIAYQVPADTKGAVKVMRDGVAEHWAVEDPYLLDAISAMSYAPPGIVKAMAPFKRLLTFGVTVNPTFKIRNLIRDSLSAMAQSDLSYNPAANVANGWKATSKDSQTYASMLASGGIIKFGTQENTNAVRDKIAKLGGVVLDDSGWGRLKGQMKSLWETYEEFGDRTENVNRAALYERLVAKGHSHAEASFMARDLMDFSMSGKWETVRFLAQTVPFLNARLQGLYKLGRAAKQDPRRFAAMAGAVSLASLGLLAAYGDDDDWKKREDWDRDAYWWFKIGDTAFRVPKPFEVGAIGTLAERTAELMMSEEMTGKRFGQRISDMVFNTFAMDPTPQFIKPFIDVYANKDSFSGRPIEGMADERLRPQDRYSERTSEAARLLGTWGLPDPVRLAKGEYAGLSPKQIDFLLRGYFGWLATVATSATDMAARPLLDRGDRPAMRLRDTFLAGNFVESLPTGSSRYVTAMYEQARDVEQAWASHQAAVKAGDMEKAREIEQEEAPKLRNRLAVASAKRQVAELGQQAKRIEASRLMPAEEKRRRLDEIEARKHQVAQRVAVSG